MTYDFPPLATIGTQRPLRLLSYLDTLDWQLQVLTARPSAYRRGSPLEHPDAVRWPARTRVVRTTVVRGWSTIGGQLESVKLFARSWIRRAAGTAPDGPGPGAAHATPRQSLKRTIEELCAMPDKEVGWLLPAVIGGLRALRAARPDVIYSTAPAWTSHLVAMALASAWNVPWVADFRDPWVRSPWNRYTQRLSLAAGARLERWVVERADAVLFTTHTAREEFAAHYGPLMASKLHTVENGCNPADFGALDSRSGSPATDAFILLHAGTLYGGRSPESLLQALARLKSEDPGMMRRFRLHFLGAGDQAGETYGPTLEKLGLTSMVEFRPRVDRLESLRQIREASALLILQPGLTVAIPGKVYEYFAAGRPVLALCEPGELADTIARYNVGVVAQPSSIEGIAEALRTLMSGFEREWNAPPPALYDGRLRAAETTVILEAVMRKALASESPAARTYV